MPFLSDLSLCLLNKKVTGRRGGFIDSFTQSLDHLRMIRDLTSSARSGRLSDQLNTSETEEDLYTGLQNFVDERV